MRRHGGATAEHTPNAGVVEIDFLGQRFEQFGRGEQAADFAVLQDRHRLIDHVFHVGFGLVGLFVADDLFHPARIEIDKVTGAAAEIGEVLDGQTQPARAGRAHHQPRAAPRKMFVGNFSGEFLVVHLVIVPADALFGHAGGAAGLKNVERTSFELRRHPDFRLKVAQGFVLEMRKLQQVGERFDLFARVEMLLRPAEPERAAGLGREMPMNDFAQVGIQLFLRGFDGGLVNGHKGLSTFDLRFTRLSAALDKTKSRSFFQANRTEMRTDQFFVSFHFRAMRLIHPRALCKGNLKVELQPGLRAQRGWSSRFSVHRLRAIQCIGLFIFFRRFCSRPLWADRCRAHAARRRKWRTDARCWPHK